MVTLMQYAYIAKDVYEPMNTGYRCVAPDFFTSRTFTLEDRPLLAGGSPLSTGLQARVYFHDRSNVAVIAFKGTDMVSDVAADLIVALPLLLPRQAFKALDLVHGWKRHLKGYRLRMVGHSLGGALAQVIGKKEDIPFINFNGPGMWTNSIAFVGWHSFTRTPRDKGVNYLTGHLIGHWGVHLGHVEAVQGNGHGIQAVIDGLRAPDRDRDPFPMVGGSSK